ncbi:MAG: AhpC/TSA family protein [Saprospiraceae bacterium]|nr:AhpC/TSA family protein [Saprospiraceae bacterium]
MKIKFLFAVLAFAGIAFACKKEASTEVTEEVIETAFDEANNVFADFTNYDLEGLGISSDEYFKPIKVGAKAPTFELTDSDGKAHSLSSLTKEGPVAMIFYRGEWCPLCNNHLKALTDNIAQLEEKGVQLIAVTPEPYESVAKMKEKSGANFLVLSDPAAKVMKDYGVAFKVTEDYQNKVKEKLGVELNATPEGDVLLPVPATVVINQAGDVVYSHFDPRYSNRASTDDILAVL